MSLLTLSPLIGNNMIMQQGAGVPLWGKAAAGTAIAVSFLDKIYSAQTDSSGAWRVTLDSHDIGGPHIMEIRACADGICEKRLISDIYISDVWICSGQSNMEMPMERLQDDFPEEWEAPVNPLIRQFKVPQEWDFSGPRNELRGGSWVPASPETLHEFSGTAWFFARSMFEKHHTPIGLINASWGGTPAEAWMSREALAAFPEKIVCGTQYADPVLCDTVTRNSEALIRAWEEELNAGDTGLTQAWYKSESNCADGTAVWDSIMLPGDFSGIGIKHFCGSIWLRRDFEADETFAGREARLWLGTITDSDTVYINGVETGRTGYRYPSRKYLIPAGLLRKGTNRIVIRVICRRGDGGVTKEKDFRIFSDKGSIELGGSWEYRIGLRITNPGPEAFFIQRQPMGLFNAMIAPITDYPRRGVLWYQGESNDTNPQEYAALLHAMINDWRGKMGQSEMPFLVVQLPIYGEPEDNNEASSWAVIREAQCSILTLPATGMAAGLELGEWNDLHPLNKKGIGRRLALAAEQVVFNENNSAPGPMLRGITVKQNRLFLHFDRCGAGLHSRKTPYISIVAGDKTIRLPAEISGPDTVSADISAIENPEKVLYAWANNPRDRQLYNADGLPVIPFRGRILRGGDRHHQERTDTTLNRSDAGFNFSE